MFGVSSTTSIINTQLVIPSFSYVFTQRPHVRVVSQKSRFKNKTKVASSSADTIPVSKISHENNQSNFNGKESYGTVEEMAHTKELVKEVQNILTPQALRNISLYGLLQPQSHTAMQMRKYSALKGNKMNWKEKHSSYNSFDENIVGYSKEENSYSHIINHILSSAKKRNLISLIHFDLKANFHTQKSIDRRTVRQSVLANKLKGFTLKDPITQLGLDKESNKKLNNLLNEENSEESQKNIKVAFAEGYIAANPTKPSKISYFYTGIQNLITFLGMCLVVYVLLSYTGSSILKNVGGTNEVMPDEINETFNDVRGVEEAKQELQEIVEFLKNPDKFTSLGAELPKGVLLVGPPGTGKTLLARAVAGEAGVPFFHAAGAEFDEVLVGQGARRVRDLFLAAKARAPCVVFIDEIDSVGAKRSSSALHPYANQTINQLLAEMDGFHKSEGVIVLGATNRRDDLDKALLRPGRFDVEVQVPIPDLKGRKEIFEYYLDKVKISNEVWPEVLARGTTGFTGADIKNVVNQAALRAAADQIDAVSMKHLEEARDKVLMGPEKKSRIPDEEANLLTAYHESGHTLVSYFTKDSTPLHKVTIMPRGASLGHTAYIPAKEQYHMTRSQMMAMMDSLMGGRAAEEIIYGTEMVTTGASSDLKQATSLATHMVKDLGMSDRVGLRTFENNPNLLIKTGEGLGQSTKEAIDMEIKRILQESYERATNILKMHAKEHKALTDALMKYETLDADDIKTIVEGRQLHRKI